MDMEFKKFSITDGAKFQSYANLRPVYLSERQFVNQYIWQDYYDTHYYCNNTFLMCVTGEKKGFYPMMPLCKEEDIPMVFTMVKEYWNTVLNKPLNMYLIDQTFLEAIKAIPGFEEEFKVVDDRDSYDYIYDAQKLRTLSGKIYHKKKNHVNSFMRKYEGHYEYKVLDCSNIKEIEDFHDKWLENRDYEDKHNSIRSEENGIHNVFRNCSFFDTRMGGVYVDGKLQAYSIGSYAPDIKCAFIHIEKANINIPGLYNYINQQFLVHSFPDAQIVNREDDLGQEGLRKSKLSYKPIRFETKYHIYQK